MTAPTKPRLDRQAAKERTRDALLDAAAEVFARRGIEAASLDEVADAAGYTKGAIYSNFASKTELVLALLERRVRAQAAMAEAVLDAPDAEAALRAADSPPGGPEERAWLVLAMELWLRATRDPAAQRALAAEFEHGRSAAASLLVARYAADGATPPLPARDLAIVMEALALGLAIQAVLDPAAVPADLRARTMERLLRD
jgi:AcrR family transcriptional regulator